MVYEMINAEKCQKTNKENTPYLTDVKTTCANRPTLFFQSGLRQWPYFFSLRERWYYEKCPFRYKLRRCDAACPLKGHCVSVHLTYKRWNRIKQAGDLRRKDGARGRL